MINKRYLVVKNKEDKAITYFEYDKINGFDYSPKKGTKIEDAINVNKVVIINPTLANKVAKKKVDIKFKKLIQLLNIVFETDDETGTAYREALDEVNRLRMEVINKYKKQLAEDEFETIEKKLKILETELKVRLFYLEDSKNYTNEQEIGRRSR